MPDLLTLDRDPRGVYTLTIRRPEVRNALNEQAFHELIAACEQVGADSDARVLVLAGQGRAFSAGGDFDALQKMLDGDRAHAVTELENAGAGIAAGLVTEVAPAASFDRSLGDFVDRLAALAPLALKGNKRAPRNLEQRTLEEPLALEAQIQAGCIRSAGFREGLDAFQNERAPLFEGK